MTKEGFKKGLTKAFDYALYGLAELGRPGSGWMPPRDEPKKNPPQDTPKP